MQSDEDVCMEDSYGEDDYNDDDDVYDFGDDYIETNPSKACCFGKRTYTVLQESEIRTHQEERITHVSSTLSVSKPAASKLLCHFKWDVSLLLDQWFANEEKIRTDVGLSNTNVILFDNKLGETEETLCGICFERFPRDDFHVYPSNCGHLYCVTCWASYITISINDGPGCLFLKCPYPKCGAAVCRDMVDKLVGTVQKEKYNRFFIRSFVEGRKKAKWCPAPGCENAIEFEGGDVFDVTCLCTHEFCWNCIEEVHRPVGCEQVSNWIAKNSSESENTTWILANSKPCPKCGRPIEKNHGCMHMSCSVPCKFEFCWLCLGEWSKHGEGTGGFFACNKYEADRNLGLYNEVETKRRRAKQYLEKYTHYYERWDSNDKSRQKAVKDLVEMKNNRAAKLSEFFNVPEIKLEFISRAWEQIIECRRVLKWAYVYGYYLPEDQKKKRHLFEFLQGEAEFSLERLHQCAEKELFDILVFEEKKILFPLTYCYYNEKDEEEEKIIKAERGIKFREYEEKLFCLTTVTGSYFDKLVKDLEKGLSEVEEKDCGSSSFKDDDDGLDKSEHWTCGSCTYANSNTSQECEVCHLGIPPSP